jgi:3D (Asp-Asp-Asp) domain-containing protein
MKLKLYLLVMLFSIIIPQFNISISAKESDVKPLEQSETITLGDLGIGKKMKYLGELKITHYTPDPDENGWHVNKQGKSITATGNLVIPGITAAMLRGSVPFGTRIYIEGYGIYVVDDCGVGPNQVDVAVADKKIAKELGVKYARVWILEDIVND